MFPAAVYATPRASCFVNDQPVEIRRISAGASICIPVPSAGARLVVARRHPGGRWNVDGSGAVDRVARPRLKQPREKKREERGGERGRWREREKKEKKRVGFVGERKEGKRDREKRACEGCWKRAELQRAPVVRPGLRVVAYPFSVANRFQSILACLVPFSSGPRCRLPRSRRRRGHLRGRWSLLVLHSSSTPPLPRPKGSASSSGAQLLPSNRSRSRRASEGRSGPLRPASARASRGETMDNGDINLRN